MVDKFSRFLLGKAKQFLVNLKKGKTALFVQLKE